jgi:drug/metabolite transporter (DMT)-like permease
MTTTASSGPAGLAAGDNLRGIIAMIAAMFVLTLNFAFVKLAGASLPVGEVLFLRGLIAALLVAIAALASGAYRRLPMVLHRTVLFRTLFECSGATVFVVALIHTPIATATVILQAMPLLITAGAALFLGESVHWRRWAAIVVGLVGVVIVIHPGLASFRWTSLLVLVAVSLSAARDLFTRSMPDGIPTLLVAAVALSSLSAVGLSFSPFEAWIVPSRQALLQVTGSGALLSLGLFLIVLAMRRGELSIIAPFRYSAVLWAIVLGSLLWDDMLDAFTITGAFVIIGSGIYISYREHRQRRQPTAAPDSAAL